NDRLTVKLRKSGDQGGIVAEHAVAMHLGEFLEQVLDVIERVRALLMPRKLHARPGIRSGLKLGAETAQFAAQLRDFLLRLRAGSGFERVNLTLDFLKLRLRFVVHIDYVTTRTES